MTTIRERVSADPVMAELAHGGGVELDNVTTLLNAQCVWKDIPQQVTAIQILDVAPMSSVMMSLLQDASMGVNVQDRATALLSPEGLTVIYPGYEPPQVDRFQVALEILNDDGTEKL